MTARPSARLLDVTRLVARLGRGPLTGIDRVELAYLTGLAARPEPLFLLVQRRSGHALLSRAAAGPLAAWASGAASPPERRLLGLRRGGGVPADAAAALADHALGTARGSALGRLVQGALPDGGSYLNVGHMGLSQPVLGALGSVPGLRVEVLLHDTIPLDHTGLSGPGAPARFAALLAAVSRHADRVICPSRQSAADARRHLTRLGRVPPILVAPLGIAVARPEPGALPAGIPLHRPYFVTLGTIEPRKNHGLLLDAWEHLTLHLPPGALPVLFVAGRRGWAGMALFARLDAARTAAAPVIELPGLSDGAVAALLSGARALLMPSLAEGFGLPVAEAAALGVPVVASDLPVYREITGDYPIYVGAGDLYSWVSRITELTGQSGRAAPGLTPVALPSWADHLAAVLGRADDPAG